LHLCDWSGEKPWLELLAVVINLSSKGSIEPFIVRLAQNTSLIVKDCENRFTAHNPKVSGSNPLPATKKALYVPFFLKACETRLQLITIWSLVPVIFGCAKSHFLVCLNLPPMYATVMHKEWFAMGLGK
jgi:hypothetical protein